MEMDLCAEVYRIPHSEFLSWSASDRNKAVWQFLRQRKKCRRCLTRAEEWDPEQGGHRRAYRAEIRQCEGCVVLERAESAPEFKSTTRGLYAALVLNEEMM